MVKRLNAILLKISRFSAWVLLVLVIINFITGFSMTGRFGFNRLINVRTATLIHDNIWILLIIFFLLHAGISIYFALKRWKVIK